jgi:hypothetical protein
MWAHVVDLVVFETTDIDPTDRFPAEMVWFACPAETRQRWTYDGTTFSPPVAVAVPLEIQSLTELNARIAVGIIITSDSDASLNATYALDDITMGQIGAVARDFSSQLGLPGGIDTFTYRDITGDPPGHAFTGPQIAGLYQRQRDLLTVLNTQAAVMANGGPPAWPVQSGAIP